MVGGLFCLTPDPGNERCPAASEALHGMNSRLRSRLPLSRIYWLPGQMALTIGSVLWKSCDCVFSDPVVWSVQFSRNAREE